MKAHFSDSLFSNGWDTISYPSHSFIPGSTFNSVYLSASKTSITVEPISKRPVISALLKTFDMFLSYELTSKLSALRYSLNGPDFSSETLDM